PPWEPVPRVRLYFVSVAPPWGGAYFWDETARDAVREGLFRAIRKPLATEVTTCRQFRDLQLFLTPAVKCPSAKAKKDLPRQSKDHAPSTKAVEHCARFLHSELTAANPERILALGAVPFGSLCDIFEVAAPRQVARFRGQVWWIRLGKSEVPMAGTYFPGNNRHKGFDMIVEDIERLLKLAPRTRDA
ncbi:MAG TPA: uracil-DNA glycosylase family protein, partial [Candidatus Acidoferrum sp.]|nr:uracil-DNA glycosylase family protein [Candidatus Acidoferrum sp.]